MLLLRCSDDVCGRLCCGVGSLEGTVLGIVVVLHDVSCLLMMTLGDDGNDADRVSVLSFPQSLGKNAGGSRGTS